MSSTIDGFRVIICDGCGIVHISGTECEVCRITRKLEPSASQADDTPRRCRIEKMVPAERAIYDAMGEVESMPPDVRLTKAINLLREAKNAVSDFVDAKATDGKVGEKR